VGDAAVLRLQLIRPDENAALYEALYGMLMLLPQTSAFVTLRNRLNSVSSLGVLALQPNRPYAAFALWPRRAAQALRTRGAPAG